MGTNQSTELVVEHEGECPPSRQDRHWIRRSYRSVLWGVLIVTLVGCIERRLVYFPQVYPGGNWETNELPIEDAWFESADGTRLHGWFLDHPQPRAVVLFAHGNGGNITYWREEVLRLNRTGVAVMIFDYRGYGRSEGVPDEPGLLADARAARQWLSQRTGVPVKETILWGTSLGGGVMVDLASKDGARGLVLDRTFTSLPDVAGEVYPWLPASWLMRNRFDSKTKLASYTGPLLHSHGDADELIPIKLGQQLHQVALGPKQFVLMRGVGHNDPLPEEFWLEWDRFLDQLLSTASR